MTDNINIFGKFRLKSTLDLMRRYIEGESIILEIGSNDASFRGYFNSIRWTTIDKYGLPDIEADLDAEKVRLPFADSSIDIVICTEVLEHLRIGSPLVAEFNRVLKPGGYAVISVPNICSLKSRINIVFGNLPEMAASGDCGPPLGGTGILLNDHWVAGHVVDFNSARLRDYLLRAKLIIISRQKVPIDFRLRPFKFRLQPPAWSYPISFSDYILVVATPCNK